MTADTTRDFWTKVGDIVVHNVRRFLELKRQRVTDRHLLDHVIVVNNIGMPVPMESVDTVPWYARHRFFPWLEPEHLHPLAFNRDRLDHIMRRIKAEKKPVAIIIHGGLNRPRKNLKHSAEVIRAIRDDYYPIIIVWDSWVTALIEAKLLVRSGHYSPWGIVTWPLMIVGDMIRGLGLALMSIPAQIRAAYEGGPCFGERKDRGLQIARELGEDNAQHPGHNVDATPTRYTPRNPWSLYSAARFVLYLGQVAFRIVTAYVVCCASPRAWPCMRRRAQSMFKAPEEFESLIAAPDPVPSNLESSRPCGAMAVLADRLKDEFGANGGEPEVRLTLIAHSMGSVIANEFIRYAGPGIAYDDIVYMAPACSVRDWLDSVVPPLARDPRTNAYVLTLHPKREVNEHWGLGFFPRGSILDWLERFLDPPHGHLDRVAGRFDNLMRSLHLLPDCVRPRVHIKAFSYDGNHPVPPYNHTHFFRVDDWFLPKYIPPFWRREYWT